MTKRSKDPSGACPRCRKEIPLVPDSQGDLVLEVHHVLTTSAGFGDVEECPGAGDAPASLDDGGDWSWVTPDPNWVRDDSDVRPTRVAPERIGDLLRAAQDDVRVLTDAVPSSVSAPDDDQCTATDLLCRCVKAPCDGAHRCACGHSWAAREYAG